MKSSKIFILFVLYFTTIHLVEAQQPPREAEQVFNLPSGQPPSAQIDTGNFF